MFKKGVPLSFISVIFFSVAAFGEVLPLPEAKVVEFIQPWEKVFRLGNQILCNTTIITSFMDFDPFLEDCRKLGFRLCTVSTDTSLRVSEAPGQPLFEIHFLNSPVSPTFKAMKVIEIRSTQNAQQYSEIERFTAFLTKENSDRCLPYSISKGVYDSTLTKTEVEVLTQSSSQIFLERISFSTDAPMATQQVESTSATTTKKVGFFTDRNFDEYLHRLNLKEEEVQKDQGTKYLSVGEGNSNFTAELNKRGIDAWSVDAEVKNIHAPEKSKIALAQNLPFPDNEFKRTVSVWLIPHFFREDSINNPEAGRKALSELVRVTQPGGEILINPIHSDDIPRFFEELRAFGQVEYQVTYLDSKNELVILSPEQALNIDSLRTLSSSNHLEKAVGTETITMHVKKLK